MHTYDAIGNPLTYRDGMSFTWQNGRQLATASKAGTSMSFTYDDSGIRQSKTVGGVTTSYTTTGSTILAQTTGGNSTYFEYDEMGRPFRMEYGGNYYYYIYNAQNYKKIFLAFLDGTCYNEINGSPRLRFMAVSAVKKNWRKYTCN